MKTLWIVLLSFSALLCPAQERQPGRRMRNVKLPQAQFDAIKAQMADLTKAWNAGDVAGMSAHMVDDVAFITATGASISGKNDLDLYHGEMMKKHFAGSHQNLTVRQIKFNRPRVGFCDVEVEITHYKSLPPGISVPRGQPLRLLTRYILTHDSRDWTIIAGQTTVVHESARK